MWIETQSNTRNIVFNTCKSCSNKRVNSFIRNVLFLRFYTSPPRSLAAGGGGEPATFFVGGGEEPATFFVGSGGGKSLPRSLLAGGGRACHAG